MYLALYETRMKFNDKNLKLYYTHTKKLETKYTVSQIKFRFLSLIPLSSLCSHTFNVSYSFSIEKDFKCLIETKLIDIRIIYYFLLVHYSFWQSETSYPMIIKLYNR